MQGLCHRFYSNLYVVVLESPDMQVAQHINFQHIPESFSIEMRQQLTTPIIALELKAAMAKHGNPGPDGLSIEFFLLMWDVIGEECVQMINIAI